MSPHPTDPENARFKAEIEEVIRKWSDGDDQEYFRRWKQLAGWARNQGMAKKGRLKRRLMREREGRCEDCRQQFSKTELEMHREDVSLGYDKSKNFGYVDSNVVLLCSQCHDKREDERRAGTST